MVKLAQEAKVPAAVFLDHSKSFELCMKAIQLGFSSVMIDGSHLPFEENVALTKKSSRSCSCSRRICRS